MHTSLVHQAAREHPQQHCYEEHLADQHVLWAERLASAHGAFDPGCRRRSAPDVGSAPGREFGAGQEIARRRIAILFGDVVGYSRLIEFDDLATVAQLRVLRRELFDPAADMCRATLSRHWADAILLGFEHPAQAVACAITLQSVLLRFNQRYAKQRQIRLRIGLSVGDVLFVDGDIHGTGANIAARLQALANPGEILLCERVHEQVQGLFPAVFEPVGTRQLHNISMQVQVLRVASSVMAPWIAGPADATFDPPSGRPASSSSCAPTGRVPRPATHMSSTAVC